MIPLTIPNVTGNERKYLNDCIDTTYISSVGEYVSKLEQEVALSTGSNFAVATSAGTTGLHVSLIALGVKAGELVIIPSFTFIATANAVAHCGAIPWVMDIDSTDWCLDVNNVKTALKKECKVQNGQTIHIKTGRRVAAIMPVYTLGNIPNMEEFRSIADEYKLPLIVDAACAIGAKHKGKKFGALADVSVISFNGNKTITCGGGGMVVGNNEALMQQIHHLTTTARIGTEYDFDVVGFNYRMTNIQAAVGCAQMERLDEFINVKLRVRQFYASSFREIAETKDVSFFPMTEGGSCWLSGIVLPNGRTIKDVRLIVEKLKEAGIESRTFWKPVHIQKPYKNIPKGNVEISEKLWERIITLPCSTNITESELEYVVKKVKNIIV